MDSQLDKQWYYEYIFSFNKILHIVLFIVMHSSFRMLYLCYNCCIFETACSTLYHGHIEYAWSPWNIHGRTLCCVTKVNRFQYFCD